MCIAPISAVEACLENSPHPHTFCFVAISINGVFTAYAHVRTELQSDIGHRGKKKCCNFYSLEAASKPALKPAARLILKDCLFCSKFAWSGTRVATEDANAFFRLAESRAVLRQLCCRPCGFDLLGMCNTSGSHGVKTDSV